MNTEIKLNLNMNILIPLGDRINLIEKRINEYVKLVNEPVVYADAEFCEAYEDDEIALAILREDLAEYLLDRCNLGAQLPCFLYLCKYLDRSHVTDLLYFGYSVFDYEIEDTDISEELLIEVGVKYDEEDGFYKRFIDDYSKVSVSLPRDVIKQFDEFVN